jgi:SAM-dependent methyltransferase
MTRATNAAQREYWNAVAGQTWAQFQESLDQQIEPLGREAQRVLAPADAEQVLDIGCGCGQTTVELAARVGSRGRVVGVDISRPMLEVARRRPMPPGVRRPEFHEVDAESGPLERAIFDAAFSRFGVMFFEDPVAAFRNIRASLKSQGRLAFVSWRPLQDNAWMRVPFEAVAPFLPPLPPADHLTPGPFALADPDRVRRILLDAGYGDVSVEPFDCRIGGGDVEATLQLAVRVGPLGAALRENPELRPVVTDRVRAVIAGWDTPQGVLMPAAAWIARASS